jgi:hypothetical protein
MRIIAASCLLASSFYLLSSSLCHASGLTVSPSYQDITASAAAAITYTNYSDQQMDLSFSLQQIIATDLLGRLQFNAPLPQTIQATDPDLSVINPNQITLNPGETATISATFNPQKLNPGTTAFLLLAKINDSPLATDRQSPTTNLSQYLGSSILVTALGGHTTQLELIKTPLSSFPLRFSPPDFLQLTLRNSGNTRSVPQGLIITQDIFGREVMRGSINRDSVAILPGSQRLIYAHLQPSLFNFPLNLHTLTLTGSDDVGQSHFTFSHTYVFIHPYLILIVLILIFFIHRKKEK